jgi:rhodanese-related sulfurtransferase
MYYFLFFFYSITLQSYVLNICYELTMAPNKNHSIRFLNLVDDAKTRIKEVNVEHVLDRFKRGESIQLIDVREKKEFLLSHIGTSRHISKGLLERDIEQHYKDLDEELILYCGGGYRSALAADALQKMGYSNVYSMAGGYRAWKLNAGPISLT